MQAHFLDISKIREFTGKNMLENYLIVHKSILPDYYEKVLEARR